MLSFFFNFLFLITQKIELTQNPVLNEAEFHNSAPLRKIKIPRNFKKKITFSSSKQICQSRFFTKSDQKTSQIDNLDFPLNKYFRQTLSTPTQVKGIYLTGYTFSNKKKRTDLINLIKNTELNTIVIDFQDSDGGLMFPVQDPELQKIPLSTVYLSRKKFREILNKIHKEGIYTIVRITTFQDSGAVKAFPDLVLKNKRGDDWKNYKNLSWLDMTNKKSWEIPAKKALEAVKMGFDEVQFDYVRFPTDGNLKSISYYELGDKKKYEVLIDFFSFLQKQKKKLGVPISVDLFGITYANYSNISRDLMIGQRLIDAVKYFDYVSPMLYPSHYVSGYLGYKNPANFPYQVISKALYDGHNMIRRHTKQPITKTRPWLQSFNLGAIYDYGKIRAEIRAVEESGSSGWILWNARNVYGIGLNKN